MLNSKRLVLIAFLVATALALFLNNAFLGVVLFFFLGVLYPRLILAQLLLISVIEGPLIMEPGTTISKILIFGYILYFIIVIIYEKWSLKFQGQLSLLFFLLIVLVGLVNVFFDEGVVNYAGGPGVILNRVFFSNIPRLILFYLVVVYYKNKGLKFISDSINIISGTIPVLLIIILIYFLLNYRVESWNSIVDRAYLENSNPNEFTMVLDSFLPFLFYNLLIDKNIVNKILNYFGIGIILYIAILSGSRGGFLTFFIATFIILYFEGFIKLSINAFLTLSFVILTLSVVMVSGLVDFSTFLLRFTYNGPDLNAVTASRWDFWKNAVNLFPQRPIIGYGLSNYTSRYYNGLYTPGYNVMHSIFFQTLFQLGLLGVLALFALLKDPLKMLFSKKLEVVYLLPFLSLVILLVGGLSTSWLWREVIWINLGVCYSILNLKNYENI